MEALNNSQNRIRLSPSKIILAALSLALAYGAIQKSKEEYNKAVLGSKDTKTIVSGDKLKAISELFSNQKSEDYVNALNYMLQNPVPGLEGFYHGGEFFRQIQRGNITLENNKGEKITISFVKSSPDINVFQVTVFRNFVPEVFTSSEFETAMIPINQGALDGKFNVTEVGLTALQHLGDCTLVISFDKEGNENPQTSAKVTLHGDSVYITNDGKETNFISNKEEVVDQIEACKEG